MKPMDDTVNGHDLHEQEGPADAPVGEWAKLITYDDGPDNEARRGVLVHLVAGESEYLTVLERDEALGFGMELLSAVQRWDHEVANDDSEAESEVA
jgi:hypothetical protein